MILETVEIRKLSAGDYISIDGGDRCLVKSIGETSDTHTTLHLEYNEGLQSSPYPTDKAVQRFPAS